MSVPRDSQTFGSLLRKYRRAAGLTQEALAEQSGVGTRTIQHLEANGVRPRHATILDLARALGLEDADRRALENWGAQASLESVFDGTRQLDVAPRQRDSQRVLAMPLSQPVEPSRSSALVALPRPARTNLPQPPNALIGRERDVEDVSRLVLHDDARLVTLTGVGGSGKTRLALAAATAVAPAFQMGVWLVELAPVSDPMLVPMAVATALGVREAQGVSVTDAVLTFLSQRSALLVLDNCEHLIDAAAQFVEGLLAGCVDLRILATSREALNVAGERRYRVQPLAMPDAGELAGAVEAVPSPAVALFLARARAVEADFALTRENAEAIAQICTQLAGIPLALELAAARVRVLSAEQIHDRLIDCFRLLVGGGRTAPTRQRTLRATLDWSYELLTSVEQAAFRQLAVFAGGWDLEAAEAVCGEDVLELLSGLVDKSLVLVENGSAAARYRLLEPVRQYARQQLDASGEADAAQAHHAAHYAALAELAEPGIRSRGQIAWLERLDREQDNLRAALGWSLAEEPPVQPGRLEPGGRLMGALHLFWYIRCHFTEARRWGETAQRLRDGLSAGVRGRAAASLANILHIQGDFARAEALCAEASALLRQADDRWWTGFALGMHGLCMFYAAGYARAVELFHASLEQFRAQDDAWGIGWSLACLGRVAMAQGEPERAVEHLEESVRVQRQAGDPFALALSLVYRGRAALAQGDFAGATDFSEESLALYRAVVHPRGMGYALANLGQVARARADRALALLAQSLVLQAEQGDRSSIAELLEAFASTSMLARRDEPRDTTLAQDDLMQTGRLMGAAAALRESIQAPLRPGERRDYDRDTESVRSALGQSRFDAAWTEGRTMPLERAIAQALALADETG